MFRNIRKKFQIVKSLEISLINILVIYFDHIEQFYKIRSGLKKLEYVHTFEKINCLAYQLENRFLKAFNPHSTAQSKITKELDPARQPFPRNDAVYRLKWTFEFPTILTLRTCNFQTDCCEHTIDTFSVSASKTGKNT